MNDTPRIDEFSEGSFRNRCDELDRLYFFARQLERELAVERAADWRALMESEVANLRAELAASVRLERERNDTANRFMRQAGNLQAELANERELADRLALIVDDIRYYDGLSPGAKQPVKEVLAAWKEARNPAQNTTEGAE